MAFDKNTSGMAYSSHLIYQNAMLSYKDNDLDLSSKWFPFICCDIWWTTWVFRGKKKFVHAFSLYKQEVT